MQFGGAGANKSVAPLFGKPFLVPLVDDFVWAVTDNPGIKGIFVKRFEPNNEAITDVNSDPARLTLPEAAAIVATHYAGYT